MAKQPRLLKVNCQRPTNWSESQITRAITQHGYVLGEFKEDGFRFHAFIMDGDVKIVTREGIEIRSLEDRKRYLRGLLETLPAGFYVDGEVVVPGIPFEQASGILRRFEKVPDEYTTMFHVWDTAAITALTGAEVFVVPYVMRKEFLLKKMLEVPYPSIFVKYTEAKVLHSIPECHEFFEFARKYNKEGAVIKNPQDGTKNGKVMGWWKLKPEDTCDGKITGLVWGTAGLANEGKVIGFRVLLENGVTTNVTGITQAQMQEFTEQANTHWDTVNPYNGRYVEIEFMEYTDTGDLRHGNFKCFRDLEYCPGVKF